MDPNEALARAAGIYSGEGGMYCYDEPKTTLALKIAQNNCDHEPEGAPSMLTQFREAVGMGEIKGPYFHAPSRQKSGNRRPTWTYYAGQDVAEAVFEKIKPWLSISKTRQGEEALARWRLIERHHLWGTDEAFGCGHPRTPENTQMYAVRGAIYGHCRECHRKRSEERNRRIAAERRAAKEVAL